MRRAVIALSLLAIVVSAYGPPAVVAAPPSYSIVDLGIAGYGIGYGMNETPVVVGHAETPSFTVEAVRWDAGVATTLASLNGAGGTLARAVTDDGSVVVGESYDGLGGVRAVTWSGATPTALPPLTGNFSTAFDINDSGLVVGDSQDASFFTVAARWDAGAATALELLPGGANSHARGVNEAGAIIGESEIEPGGRYHAVTWQGTTPTDLGTLPGDDHSNGVDINDAGHATGRSLGRPSGGQFAFFWDGAVMSEIPLLPGGTFLEARGINNLDQVVGRGDQYGAYQSAFLWEASTGATVDLQTLLPGGSGWQLEQANAINDAGQITGYGYHDGQLHAFLMTPAATSAPTDTMVASLLTGGAISTDTGDAGASPTDPIATTVETPVDGTVVIREGVGFVGVPGFTVIGQPITIQAPSSVPELPFRVTFAFDASVIPGGESASTIQIYRDGEPALACLSSSIADPDPCVAERETLADGDAAITVLTSHASVWAGLVADAYDFSFRSPVDGPPVANVVKAASAIPVRFTFGADLGLEIFGAVPASRAVPCDGGQSSDPLEEIATPGVSGLSYDPGSQTYTYVWKTVKGWSGCRELVLDFADAPAQTAIFRFGR